MHAPLGTSGQTAVPAGAVGGGTFVLSSSPLQCAPSSGCTIGAYRLGATLGVGTFGKVRLAVHERTGQRVAVKIVSKAKMRSMQMINKLKREIAILASLKHPHVIRLYELIDTPTDIFIVMEYVAGGELFDYIVQKTRLSETEARRFFQQLVSAVEHCHQHLVCHRDLKPENILLDESLNVKVGDFGLSNFMRDGDFLKTSCGSPNYASPEVVSGKAYAGPEVDVWSLGVILYALLCGSLPFDDEYVPNLFKKIRQGSFACPGHLSRSSRHLLSRLLAVDPHARASIYELKNHPWVYRGMPLYLRQLQSQAANRSPHRDALLLAQLEKLGYEPSALEALQNQADGQHPPSREMVAYQLLFDKRAKQLPGGETAEEPATFPEWQGASASCCSSPASRLAASARSSLYKQLGGEEPNEISLNGGCVLTEGNAGNSPFSAWASCRWKLGVEATLDGPILITAILNTLKACEYEWRLLSNYKLHCRPVRPGPPSSNSGIEETGELSPGGEKTEEFQKKSDSLSLEDSSATNVVLGIQLYRLSGSRYVIDIVLLDGSAIGSMSEALWITSAIYSALTQLQRQQQRLAEATGAKEETVSSTETGANSSSSSSEPSVLSTWSPTTPVVVASGVLGQKLFP